MAARRALTFLEQQPEVDPARMGACGHSMGGKLTTDLAGIDRRVKAAVPSCGGAGDVLESQTDLPGCVKVKRSALELACISDNAYLPRITCPMLWLSPTNDFNAPIGNMAWNWRNLPDDRTRFSISPHLNHHHTDEHALTQLLWFEEHLKGAFKMPQTPHLLLNLKTADGVPRITVTPDDSKPVQRVDIFYALDPHELTRFWRDAKAVQAGKQWQAVCPVMTLEQPIFAYANVIYETPEPYRKVAQAPGHDSTTTFAISSRVVSATPAQLRAAGVKATDQPERMIDDGSRGWHDWYRLNWDHPPLWTATTRKLKDAKWRGPHGATLALDIKSHTDNALVIKFNCNAWGAFAPGQPAVDYTVAEQPKGSQQWQRLSVSLDELTATDPKITASLANWQTVTEFSISPYGETVQDGQKMKVAGRPWQGPREIRNLRWDGGVYLRQRTADSVLAPSVP
ncbi:MAG: dienelactone hydrolase family protein [Verrucomicrobia bacterium]|nr:dienelactone hydrolase family protein [Verrucomicrobiota bacterium]